MEARIKIETVEKSGVTVAVVTEGTAITDAASAMKLAMTVRYETGCSRIAIDKKLVCGDFFILSTQLAGEILQKFINYRVKMAIYGDYSRYTSKPLHDFIYESNQGKDFFFVATKEEALEKLSSAG